MGYNLRIMGNKEIKGDPSKILDENGNYPTPSRRAVVGARESGNLDKVKDELDKREVNRKRNFFGLGRSKTQVNTEALKDDLDSVSWSAGLFSGDGGGGQVGEAPGDTDNLPIDSLGPGLDGLR